jgi:copper ion binding protein
MKKFALILMIAIFAIAIAVPAFGCDKTAAKDCQAICAGKASCDKQGKDAKACAAKCEAMKKDGQSTASKASATTDDNMTVTSAVATSNTKTSVNMTGEGCAMGKSADATKSGHTCTAVEKAKCGVDKKEGASSAKLPNGHPVQTVAEALKPEGGSMVAFLAVDKMTCQSCVDHISKIIGSMDGVYAVDVNLKKASTTVVFHADKVKTDDMVAAINKAGYVAKMKTEFNDDMKAVFGDNYSEKSKKSCANLSKDKADTKNSES